MSLDGTLWTARQMNVRPPVVALLCLAAAAGIDRLLPSPPRLPPRLRPTGIVPLSVGSAFGAWALARFHAAGTTYEPFETPTTLVATGPYRYTRNPMYLGLLLLLAGSALLTGRVPLLLATPTFYAIMSGTQIPREERLLEQQFGESFRAYAARVPRWL
jgi:protein-S-isoprenylcysteine O-methyltransferase Ste14